MRDEAAVASVNPPAWAQALLGGVLPRRTEQDISGDLLEEYRVRAATAGARRADGWYARQALGFLWRLAGVFAALVAIGVLTREIYDVVVGAPPDGNWSSRSMWTTYSAVLTYVATGFYAGVRTRRLTAGVLAAWTAHVLGDLAGIAGMIALYLAVLRHDPAAQQLFMVTGGWEETVVLPVVLLIPVTFLSVLGGMAGKVVGRRPARQLT